MEAKYNTRSPAVKRLMREALELSEATYDYFAQPLSDNLFEWHFTVRGPVDTEFDGGIYHGRIVLPPDYPMKPPNIIVLTPNGRFETGKKICLSISGHHPESWQPSWSIRTALLAIIGFMPTPSQGTIGSLDYPAEERKKLARKSAQFQCPDCGGLTVDLLKSKAETGGEILKSTAEEAKEIIKTMSIKSEDEVKKELEGVQAPKKEETDEEKYKRARKLYSTRMQEIIKKRLNQTSTPESSGTSTPSTRTTTTSSVQRVNPEQQQQQQQQQQSVSRPAATRQADQARSFNCDIIIAIIVVVIAFLLYRRMSLPGSDSIPGPPAPNSLTD